MKKKNILKMAAFVLTAGMLSAAVGHAAFAKADKKQTIYAGIYLDGAYVGGLTKDEAMEKYAEYTEGIEDLKLTFTTAAGEYSVALSDIDFKFSVEGAVEEALNYGRQGNILARYKAIKGLEKENFVLVPEKSFDKKKLKKKLEEEAEVLIQEPKNATITKEDDKFVIHDGEVGQELLIDETVQLVEERLKEEWEQRDVKIAAAVNEQEPEYTAEDFSMIDSELGHFETEYNQGNADRSQNLKTGAEKINGTVLFPGDQFSVYKTVAPFTEENGYRNAGQYVNNELVDGLGGGICQVSTTLYNAVLFAELEVDERYPHSLTVSYVKLSRDAAIAGDYMDFKFTNSTEYPIYIEGHAGDGKISFSVYGHETRPDNRTIEFETKVVSENEPGDPEEIEDDTMEEGEEETEQEGHMGYDTELYKKIYIDGELQETVRVNTSHYMAQKAKVRIGTKPKEEEVEEPPVEPPTEATTEKQENTTTTTEQEGAA